jgi:RNA polymerase sigma factor (sigma-70 family)
LVAGKPRLLVVPSYAGRDDGAAMALDGRRARRLARKPDAELLALTGKDSDGEAFAVFYERHASWLLTYFTRRTGNREIAQDIAAEAWAVVYVKAASFDPTRGEGRGWLFGIARNTMLASFRRGAVEQATRRELGLTVVGHSEEAWDEAVPQVDATVDDLVEGLSDLPAHERIAVVARILDEREYAEIARAENVSEAAIRQRVSRGLRTLHGRLKRGPE